MRTSARNYNRALARGLAVIMIAALPTSAYTQANKGPATERSEKQKKEDEAIDKAYREALKSKARNEPAAKTDPWQTIRPAGSGGTKN